MTAIVASAALSFGCSSFKFSPIPDPFSRDMITDKVIKEIRVEGNHTTRGSLIRRSMASKEGELYTNASAQLDKKWLLQLGIFTTIQFTTEEDAGEIILTVSVTEVNPYIPAPSFKITEETGFEFGLSVTSANLFGLAARLSGYARTGGATNLGVRYKDPWLPDNLWFFGASKVDYFHLERKNKVFEFDESSDDLSALVLWNYTTELRWGPKISFLSVKSDRDGITLDDDNHDNIPGIGGSIQFDTRDFAVYPTNGWWTEIEFMQYGVFGGNGNYSQGNFDLRRYANFGSKFNSIAFYSLTTLTDGTVGVDIPYYQQFSIGGANTVRGWDLGAREGKNQFINTLEYWYLIGDYTQFDFTFLKQILGLQAAVFVDAGTVWNTTDQFHQHWIVGGGIGLRLLLPSMVMVRFDLAVGQEGPGLGIFIGSQEKATTQRDRVR